MSETVADGSWARAGEAGRGEKRQLRGKIREKWRRKGNIEWSRRTGTTKSAHVYADDAKLSGSMEKSWLYRALSRCRHPTTWAAHLSKKNVFPDVVAICKFFPLEGLTKFNDAKAKQIHICINGPWKPPSREHSETSRAIITSSQIHPISEPADGISLVDAAIVFVHPLASAKLSIFCIHTLFPTPLPPAPIHPPCSRANTDLPPRPIQALLRPIDSKDRYSPEVAGLQSRAWIPGCGRKNLEICIGELQDDDLVAPNARADPQFLRGL
ncbi:hypothetical protein DFH09DRAFT_1103491 [Mycena vulgaris]|nr:hypothetical protein DFH09DRAFT_1103491 [Mycena vulgaris]